MKDSIRQSGHRWFVPVIAILIVATIQGGWTPSSGSLSGTPQLPDPCGTSVVSSSQSELADDWTAPITSRIRDVHYWGAWESDSVGIIDSFQLRIYENDTTGIGNPALAGRPGDSLWGVVVSSWTTSGPYQDTCARDFYDPAARVYDDDNHYEVYEYDITLDPGDYFQQLRNDIYWLSIYAWLRDTAEPLWCVVETPNLAQAASNVRGVAAKSEWSPLEVTEYTYVPGDVNSDGVANEQDAVYLAEFLVGTGPEPMCFDPATVPLLYPCADANGDCFIDDFDVQCLFDPACPREFCIDFPPDSMIELTDLSFVLNGTCCLSSGDIDHNGQGPDIADLVTLVSYMFSQGEPPDCSMPYDIGSDYFAEADANGDGVAPDIADLVHLVNYMLRGGPPPFPCE